MQLIKIIIAAGCVVLCGACAPLAEPKTASDATESPESLVTATIRESRADGAGDVVGIVQFQTSPYGLLIVPNLHGLGPGPHALHIHENPDCGPSADGNPAGAAGSHYDPYGSNLHAGPYKEGHLGDLPNLIVEADGSARIAILAPRPTLADVRGRALMLHAGADKYESYAEHQHGTGGPRMYCGVIG
jgi:Cu-Zn family superoxide dismutase